MAEDHFTDTGLSAFFGMFDSGARLYAKQRDRASQRKQHKRRVAHQCTFCGNARHDNLRACSLCKSARYCNRECQVADYKARHRQECAEFVYPPLIRSFMTEPLGGEQFPARPVFAHAHEKGVGCWVSVAGQVNCNLGLLSGATEILGNAIGDPRDVLARGEVLLTPHGRMLAARSKAYARSLLSLVVLVQNRRKDPGKEMILVYGSLARLVGLPDRTDDVLRGRSALDNMHTFMGPGGRTFAGMGVAEDPWENRPRLRILNVNGMEIGRGTPFPPSVQYAAEGVVALGPGDYVIYHLQFRVGDGDRIFKDFDALGCLGCIDLPWSVGSSIPAVGDILLAGAAARGDHPMVGRTVAPFHQPTIREYYDDYILRGEKAFVDSRFGQGRAELTANGMQMMGVMVRELVQSLDEEAVDQTRTLLRAAGLEGIPRWTQHTKSLRVDLSPGLVCEELLRASNDYFSTTQEKESETKKHKRRVSHQCTFCGRVDYDTLRACSLCKSARYCNRECQMKDYKTRHRHECANFMYPPLTRSFTTEAIEGEKYPQRPVFAHEHNEGVGCWVSIDENWVDCSLKRLVEQLHADERPSDALLARQMELNSQRGQAIAEKNRAHDRTMLTLSVLVQNRRKDNKKIVVYGARSQLMGIPHLAKELVRTKSDIDIGRLCTKDLSRIGTVAFVGIPDDPWDKLPRLLVRNINGTDYKATERLPPAVLDGPRGIVSLSPGDYVIYSMQFRAGDGGLHFSLEFESLSSVCMLSLPWLPWEQGVDPLLHDNYLVDLVYKSGPHNNSLFTVFDRVAIREYYNDYITHGPGEFIESHYGKEYLDSLNRGFKMLVTMGEHLERHGGGQQDERMDQLLVECLRVDLHKDAARFIGNIMKIF